MSGDPGRRGEGWRTTFACGALTAAAAVGAGAFGAHALAARLDTRSLALWETAARYLMYAGLGLLAFGAVRAQLPAGARGGAVTTALLAAGGWVFALTVGTIALGGPRSLGAVTPLGGLAMIGGFVSAALVVWRSR